MRTTTNRGFSLIELLTVMAIMVIVLAFAVPATKAIMKGNRLTQTTQMIVDQLALARQIAIAKNRTVEVRFYKYIDPDSAGGKTGYRALQTLEVRSATQFVPADKIKTFPQLTIVDSSSQLSSLLAESDSRSSRPGKEPLPGKIGTNYEYMSVRFRPNGSTDLDPTKGPWFLTIHDELPGDNLAQPPPNFVTIQIDPVSGTLKFFRPGV